MDRFQLDYIAHAAGCWVLNPHWEDARQALREGRILPPKWLLEAASDGDSEAAQACVSWVCQAIKIEKAKALMKEIEAEERERIRSIAKRRKAIERMKAREETLA